MALCRYLRPIYLDVYHREIIPRQLYMKDTLLQEALGIRRNPVGVLKPTRNTVGRWVFHCDMTGRAMSGVWGISG